MQALIEMNSKQLFALLQLFVISSIINNDSQVSAVAPNERDLKRLAELYLVPNFGEGRLARQGHSEFAVALLLPDTNWMDFEYHPSAKGDGLAPVINPEVEISPPDKYTANNYIATRPNTNEHAEKIFLDYLTYLYEVY